MAAKFVVFFGMVAAAAALPVVPVAHVAYEPEAPAHYQYQYSIHDGVSGDVKEQQEAREGDAVHGSYSFVQPDGVHRIVEYTADKEHGFNAVVRYEGTPIPAPTKVPVSAPVAYAPVSYAPAKVAYAPAKVYSPVSYSAPVYSPVSYSSPVYSPVSKVAYEAPLGHVTFSSPVASYHH